jgi:hypothetical protein
MMRRLLAFTALLALLPASTVTANPWDDLVLDRPATISPPGFAERQAARRVTNPPPPPIPADWQCSEWYETSLAAGFERSDWPALGIIMWRESRCRPTVHNGSDPNTGSFGLTQINGYWCRGGGLRNLGWPAGNHCPAMFDPLTNLQAARAIVQYDRDRGRCSWQQWSTRRGLC